MTTVLIYMASWFGLAAIAVLNAVVRQKVYGHLLPPIRARQLSMIIGFCLFSVYIWLITGMVPIMSGWLAFVIAGVWFGMATALKSFVEGSCHNHSFRDHDLLTARLWTFVLLWTWVLRLF